MTYDVENRTVSATRSGSGTEYYAYGPSNERVWKREEFTGGIGYNFFYFYGADGALLTTNSIDDDWDYNVYFAGRTVWREQVSGSSIMPPMPVSPDRLGSNVKHFPFGDEPLITDQNREKFATYYRDEVTALDYARNRYYSSTIARFTTADPYGPSARLNTPQTLNRYSYVANDPGNFNDPSGLCPPGMREVDNGAQINLILDAARSYIGHGLLHADGKQFEAPGGVLTEIDCGGLVGQALAGILFSDFSVNTAQHTVTTATMAAGAFTQDSSAHLGDIIYFPKWMYRGVSQGPHVGIVTGVDGAGNVTSFIGSQNRTGPAEVTTVKANPFWSAWMKQAKFYKPCIPDFSWSGPRGGPVSVSTGLPVAPGFVVIDLPPKPVPVVPKVGSSISYMWVESIVTYLVD